MNHLLDKKYLLLLTIIISLATWLSLSSFQQKETPKKGLDVKAEVAKRIATFRKKENKKCFDEALVEANRLVDSMLLDHAKAAKQSGLDRPPKPPKPEKPEISEPTEFLPVEPIINKQAEEKIEG